MVVIPLPNVTEESVVTPLKASSGTSARLAGRTTLERRVPRNAKTPIEVMPLWIVTAVRLSSPSNAQAAMLTNSAGMVQ